MALVRPIPSPETTKAYREGFAELIELGRAPRGLAAAEYPQEIYALDLKDVRRGTGIEHAKPVVWQFLLGSASGPAFAADVGHPPPGRPPRMTSLARGPLIAKAIRTSQEVELLPQVQANNYELRRLWISGLSIHAFWLKSMDGRDDLMVPYHALAEELNGMQAYAMQEFMAVVRRLARKRLKSDDSPRRRH
jgi:hypothetical protein